jgi:hypothetical protein
MTETRVHSRGGYSPAVYSPAGYAPIGGGTNIPIGGGTPIPARRGIPTAVDTVAGLDVSGAAPWGEYA